MVEKIAFENGQISNFEGLVTLTLDRVILHTRVVVSVSMSRSRDVLTPRLEKNCQRLGLVSAIYVSCPRAVFGQIVQAALTNHLLQSAARNGVVELKPGLTPGLTYCPVTHER